MNERIQIWLDRLTFKYNQSQANMVRSMGSNIVPSRIQYFVEEGKKYYKITYSIDYNDNNQSKTVHAFVDKATGDVYKAATFRAPAKIVRYNLLDDNSFNDMIEKCDWAGSYLYIR